jgi:hypothetical protein
MGISELPCEYRNKHENIRIAKGIQYLYGRGNIISEQTLENQNDHESTRMTEEISE